MRIISRANDFEIEMLTMDPATSEVDRFRSATNVFDWRYFSNCDTTWGLNAKDFGLKHYCSTRPLEHSSRLVAAEWPTRGLPSFESGSRLAELEAHLAAAEVDSCGIRIFHFLQANPLRISIQAMSLEWLSSVSMA